MVTASHPFECSSLALAKVFSELPPVRSASAGQLRNEVIRALSRRDADTLNRVLDDAQCLEAHIALRAIWLPILLGFQAWVTMGREHPHNLHINQRIRAMTRQALLTIPELPLSRWLVPSTLGDATAAHLAVFALALRGLGARVWTWPIPPPGPCLVIGDVDASDMAGDHIPILRPGSRWPTLAALVA